MTRSPPITAHLSPQRGERHLGPDLQLLGVELVAAGSLGHRGDHTTEATLSHILTVRLRLLPFSMLPKEIKRRDDGIIDYQQYTLISIEYKRFEGLSFPVWFVTISLSNTRVVLGD